GRAKASPLARRVAAQLDVGLHGLAGSGPNGRVTRADVERAATEVGDPSGTMAPAPAEVPRQHVPSRTEAAVHAKGETAVHELSRLQRTVARRMAESRATVPDFELRCELGMSG